MKRWIHAYTAIEDDPFESVFVDPCYEDPSYKGCSIDVLRNDYNDYVDKNAYPTFREWVAYLKEQDLY